MVRIDAPLDTIEARVRQRYQRLGTVQRWLEPDLTTGDQIKIVETISGILSGNGQRFYAIDCLDKETSVRAIEAMLPEIEPYQWT